MVDFADARAKIKSLYNSMSDSDKRLAQYVIDDYREMAFASAAKVGKSARVSAATVVRFANHLGLSGYAELQELARRALRQEVDMASRLEQISSKQTAPSLFHEAIRADIRNLEQVFEALSDDVFGAAVKALARSEKIYIVGLRSLYGLAWHIAYLFREIGRDARILSPGVGDVPEQLIDMTSSDACVALSFRRYTRDTVSLFRCASERGATTIAVTDRDISPLTQHAKMSLIVPVNSPAFFESRIGALSVMSALALAVANETRAKTLEALRRREAVWTKHEIYEAPSNYSRYEAAVEAFASAHSGRALKRNIIKARRAKETKAEGTLTLVPKISK